MVQAFAVSAAFWLALGLFGARRPDAPRFALGLALGALTCLVGPSWLLGRGAPLEASVLFLPLGLALVRPSSRAFAALPLPLALARLGCLAGGCCGAGRTLPLPVVEAALLAGLHRPLGRLPAAAVPGAFLLAFGAGRILVSPWRPPETALAGAGFAALWLVAGGLLLLRWARRRRVSGVVGPDPFSRPACASAATAPRGSAPLPLPKRPPPVRVRPG